MLKSDKEVALQDVIVALESAAEQYERDSESVDDSELSALLRKLAKKRSQLAADLEMRVRRQGALPQTPDPDRETVATVMRHVKAALSSQQRASLLADYQRIEQAVIDTAQKALELQQEDRDETSLRESISESEEALEFINAKIMETREMR